MTHKKIVMVPDKKIALVAHDNKKRDLLEWARFNRASADFMISSPLMEGEYNRLVPDYDEYRTRRINWGEQTGRPPSEEVKERNSRPPG